MGEELLAQFPEVDFVTDLDLETGEFVPAGIGSVEVVCRSYERELAPVPFESVLRQGPAKPGSLQNKRARDAACRTPALNFACCLLRTRIRTNRH